MKLSRGFRVWLSFCMLAGASVLPTLGLNAQGLTDPAGYINGSGFLALGPFTNPFGCAATNANEVIRGNHIGPSCIGCQFPEVNDEVDYDVSFSVSTGYVGALGPNNLPIWREFNDGGDDGDQNLDGDAGADLNDVMTWLVTYVENVAERSILLELCIGSDDGVQVWMDDIMVHNNNACRGRGLCQDRAGIILEPGLHKFAIAAWERGGGWGLSLGLVLDGMPVVDDGTFPDIVFKGREGGAELKTTFQDCFCPDEAPPQPCRAEQFKCAAAADGSANLSWANPAAVDTAIPIEVYVNGRVVATVPGDSTAYNVKAADIPAGIRPTFALVNGCGNPATCSYNKTTADGHIKSSHWLVLGPFTNTFGCGSQDAILGNHIAPSNLACEYPVVGLEVEYDPAQSVSTGYLPKAGASEIPTWRQYEDGSDNEDHDMDIDYGQDLSDVVDFMATYVENTTDTPIDVVMCVGSDDGAQVWFNNQIVHSNNACRGRALCQDQPQVQLLPGITRIILGVWERAGGWGGSLGFKEIDGITPIVDDGTRPEIIFHGTVRPAGFSPCKVLITRDIPDSLVNGTSGKVTLTVTPREGPATVTIDEIPPPLLTVNAPSNGGVVQANTIKWNLGVVAARMTISYTLAADANALDAPFASTATADGTALLIAGDTSYKGAPVTTEGFIKLWNHLGPLAWQNPAKAGDHGDQALGIPGACDANAGVDLVLDWIASADDSVTEGNINPFPGLVTKPDYGAKARAAGLTVGPGDVGRVVTDQFPSWKGTTNSDDTINHASRSVHGFDAEDHLTMSVVYITNPGAPIATEIGLGSDDAIQLILNGTDITAGGIIQCRGWGATNEEQDVVPATLASGENKLLVKVTDGCCGSGFRLRFRKVPGDPTAGGLSPPEVTYSLESTANPKPGDVVRQIPVNTFSLGGTVPVSLAVSRKVAGSVDVQETLPAEATAEAISDGGVLNAGVISWSLANVTNKTLTYNLKPTDCSGGASLGAPSMKVGSVEIVGSGDTDFVRVGGEESLIGPPWKSQDIGTTGGLATIRGPHSLFVLGSGDGIKVKADQFRLISTAANGDAAMTVRVDCFDDDSRKGQAGVMLRASEANNAAFIFLSVSTGTGAGLLKGSFRSKLDASVAPVTIADKDVAAFPVYLRLNRAAGQILIQRSSDGVNFTDAAPPRAIGTTSAQVDLPDAYLMGIAATNAGGSGARALFSEISGPEIKVGQIGTQFRRGDADGNQALELTDAISLLNYLFTGGAKPVCLDAADSDDNGEADISDAIASLNYQFLGGPPPAAPGPTTCGLDVGAETPDLGCDTGGC